MVEKIKTEKEKRAELIQTERVAAKWAELSRDEGSGHNCSSGGMITYREEFKSELAEDQAAIGILKDEFLLKKATEFASSHESDLGLNYSSAISETALRLKEKAAVEKLVEVLDVYGALGDKFLNTVIFDVSSTLDVKEMSSEKFLARCDSALAESNLAIIARRLKNTNERQTRDFLRVALEYPDTKGRILSEMNKTLLCYSSKEQEIVQRKLAWTDYPRKKLSNDEFLGLCSIMQSKEVLGTIKKYPQLARGSIIEVVAEDWKEHRDAGRIAKICEIMQDPKVYKAASREHLVRTYGKAERVNQIWLCEAARRLQSLNAVHTIVDTLAKYTPESAGTMGYMLLRKMLDYKKVSHEHFLAACRFFGKDEFAQLAQKGNVERTSPNQITPLHEIMYLFTKIARQTGTDHEIMAWALARVKQDSKTHGVDAASILSKQIGDMLEEDPVDRSLLLRKIKGEKIVDLSTKEFYLEELKAGWYDGGSIGIHGNLVSGGHVNIEQAGEKILSLVDDESAKVTTTKSGRVATSIEIQTSGGGAKDLIGRTYHVLLTRTLEGAPITNVSLSYATGYLYDEDVYRLKNKMKKEAQQIGNALKGLERK
ncbi:MAG: hypothetical protein KGH71_05050 [Candidatus Micrarchaeota archaeon]|nr:hypothetical protein [Candidatus Micrarchaeota archaeon]